MFAQFPAGASTARRAPDALSPEGTTRARVAEREASRGPDRADALVWALLGLLVLWVVPIGFVSGDGLANSVRFAAGSWHWNPNHLLIEPLSAWWQDATGRLGLERSAPDRLKLLSALAGATAVGLFRWQVAGRLAPGRLEANHATAWFALGSAFLRLWVSDETHMLQMPALALTAAAAVRYAGRTSGRTALAVGACAGLSALVYVSNLALAAALGVALAAWHAKRREWGGAARVLCGVGAASAAVAVAGFALAWLAVGPDGVSLLGWVTSYSGGQVSARAAASYGVEWSPAGLAVAVARALYGSASALVDLAPTVQPIRDGERPGPLPLLNAAAWVAAAALVLAALADAVRSRARRARPELAIVAGWTAAVLAFAVYWNNSDDQFFFQLAVPVAALVATFHLRSFRRRAVAALGALALAYNVGYVARTLVLYPRGERVELLADAVAGAGLVVLAGEDEADHLFHFLQGPERRDRITITSLMGRHDARAGLDLLRDTVAATLARGQRVEVVSVFDVPPLRHPWKALSRAGYDPERVRGALSEFAVEPTSRTIGPLTLRSILPRTGTHGGTSVAAPGADPKASLLR